MTTITVLGSAAGIGNFTVSAPSSANTRTLLLPDADTTLVGTDATQTLTNKTLTTPTITSPAISGAVMSSMASSVLTSGTPITTATGTSLDFPSIPSWVKRITISLNSISFAASGAAVVRLGVSNTLVTTGYVAARVGFTTTPAMVYTAVTDGVASFGTTVAAASATGQIVITNLTGNQWVASGQVTRTTDNVYMPTTGSITLAGTLTNLSLVATTSTFDAGSINILYE